MSKTNGILLSFRVCEKWRTRSLYVHTYMYVKLERGTMIPSQESNNSSIWRVPRRAPARPSARRAKDFRWPWKKTGLARARGDSYTDCSGSRKRVEMSTNSQERYVNYEKLPVESHTANLWRDTKSLARSSTLGLKSNQDSCTCATRNRLKRRVSRCASYSSRYLYAHDESLIIDSASTRFCSLVVYCVRNIHI